MPDFKTMKRQIDPHEEKNVTRLRHLGRVMMRTGTFRLSPEQHWRFEFEHMGRTIELRNSKFGNETSLLINTLEWSAQVLFEAVPQKVTLTTHDKRVITGHRDIMETPLYTRIEKCLIETINEIERTLVNKDYHLLGEMRVRIIMLLWFVEFGQASSFALRGDKSAFDRDMLMLFMDDSYMESVERLGAF